jgi:hypothetical protein
MTTQHEDKDPILDSITGSTVWTLTLFVGLVVLVAASINVAVIAWRIWQ